MSAYIMCDMMLRHTVLSIADDVPIEKSPDKHICFLMGRHWEGIDNYWADLVNELGEIPYGGNEYFHGVLEPSLGEV